MAQITATPGIWSYSVTINDWCAEICFTVRADGAIIQCVIYLSRQAGGSSKWVNVDSWMYSGRIGKAEFQRIRRWLGTHRVGSLLFPGVQKVINEMQK